MPFSFNIHSNNKTRDMHYHLIVVEALIFTVPFLVFLYVIFNKDYQFQTSDLLLSCVVLILILAGLLILRQILNSIYSIASSLKTRSAGENVVIDASHDITELHDITISFNNLYQNFDKAISDLNKKTRELLTIKELTEIARKSVSMDDLMDLILEKSMAVTGARIGSVFIYEPASRNFCIIAEKGHDAEIKKGLEISIDKSLAKSVVLEKKPLLVQDIEKDSLVEKKNDPKYGSPSFLSMPIFMGKEVSSVLNLACKETEKAFDDDDVNILSIMLGEIGFALNNARLYLKVDEQLRTIKEHAADLEKEIRERKRVEETLYKWAHIFEHAQWGIATSSSDGKTIEMINPTFASMHGYTMEELYGRPILDLYAPESREELVEHIRRADKIGHHSFKSLHMRKDGILFPVQVDMTSIKDKQGQVLYRAVNVKDISDQEHAQEALRESEHKFRSISEQSIVGITLLQDDLFKYVNPKFAEMFGYTVDECVDNMTYHKLVTPEDIPWFARQITECLTDGITTSNFEYRGIKKDGGIIHIEAHSSPTLYNKKMASIAMHLDITERKKTEKLLKLEEARLAASLKISHYKAKDIQDLLDYTLKQAITLTNSKIGYINYYDDLKKELTMVSRFMEQGQEGFLPELQSTYGIEEAGVFGEAVGHKKAIIINSFQEQSSLKKCDIEEKIKLLTYLAIPILIEGKVAAVVGAANKEGGYSDADVMQLTLLMDSAWKFIVNKKLEIELLEYSQHLEDRVKERTKELDEANNAKSLFLANMSHELRTPLNSIIGFSEVLEDELVGKLNESQLENVQYIHNSGRHLLNLIDDILDLAKVESGRVELEYGILSLQEILTATVIMQRERALIHGISLSFEISPEADISIEADERKLKQILFNLLSNAVKFTPDGGSVHVEAKKEVYTDEIEISVTDTGIGIKADDLPKLFKEFSQLESTYEKKYEGTGLGLALTKKLIELHNGRIWVESEYGKGSRFIFSIPAKRKVPD